tara:strand:+ start:611 stop:844 length:234 start_codon:yes stop_codon:yes gene_type:complete
MIKGDLAYLPSEVSLVQYNNGSLFKYCITQKPCHVVVLNDEKNHHHDVLYEGEVWNVAERSLYPILMEEDNGDSQAC